MANISVILGNLDISQYVRVNPGEKLDMGQGDMLEPAFSDSPLFEGQILVSLHAKNKELKIPLFLHPQQAPYLQDSLNQLTQEVNQQLRPIVDLGALVYLQWQNAQADFPTFFTVQFGRFEPEFNFRETEKGWLAGTLHLWVLPYAHTATQRVMGTWPAPPNQSGGVFTLTDGEYSWIQGAPSSVSPNIYCRLGEQSGPTVVDQEGLVVGSYGASGIEYWQPGAFPGDPAHSIYFSGTAANDSIFFPTSMASALFPSQFTYVFWLSPGSSGAQFENYPMYGVSATLGAGMILEERNFWMWWGDGATTRTYEYATPTYSPGSWHMFGLSFDGSYFYGYYDGTQLGAIAFPTFGLPGTLGYYAPGTCQQMKLGVEYFGGMQDFQVYSTPIGSGAIASLWTAGPLGAIGDLSPQFEIHVTTGSYTGDDGQFGIISALPIPSYQPIIVPSNFVFPGVQSVFLGASGAWASQFLALDPATYTASAGSPGGASSAALQQFSFAISPGSVYAGNNRVLGLVRARREPFALRAFDPLGNPLGPTVIASALDGWQLVDYGVLTIPPWMATPIMRITAYPPLDYSASGMFSPVRSAPAWTKEHGPIFVVPNDFSIMDLDWNSPALSIDGFDGPSNTALNGESDQLGNDWNVFSGTAEYTGNSQIAVANAANGNFAAVVGSGVVLFQTDFEVEALINYHFVPSSLISPLWTYVGVIATNIVNIGAWFQAGPTSFISLSNYGLASAGIPVQNPVGLVHIRYVWRGGKDGGYNAAYLNGPSGMYAGSASGVSLMASWSLSAFSAIPTGLFYVGIGFDNNNVGTTNGASVVIEAFRARLLASQGFFGRDILHLSQPLIQNTRQTPSAIDVVDLEARQRGPVQAIDLPVPSLGAGLFIASFPWDQGPANDLLNADIRVRERFVYAR